MCSSRLQKILQVVKPAIFFVLKYVIKKLIVDKV